MNRLAANAAPYCLPPERPFTRPERDSVTILFGGLTRRHDYLIQAAGLSKGYRVEIVPTPMKDDYRTGREYCSNGMCNPLYFTIGALINHLRRIQQERSLSDSAIVEQYVYATTGSGGPCRLGMYEAEYRHALRNAGFHDFRVLILEQKGFDETSGDGLEKTPTLFLSGFFAMFTADLLNNLANQIRPYERVAGAAGRAMDEITGRLWEWFRRRDITGNRGPLGGVLRFIFPKLTCADADGIMAWLLDRGLADELRACAAYIDCEVEVDYTRCKPVCKVTGEFWAQMTEGDGNYRMFEFLEAQGAEIITEPIATWFLYLLTQARVRQQERRGLYTLTRPGVAQLLGNQARALTHYATVFRLALADQLVRREYEHLRLAIGGTTRPLISQDTLRNLARPYYHHGCVGGEGHMEVGKSLYYGGGSQAHMVLSLKPFGCLPSTQSDGAMAAVQADHPDILFLPVETSGEGGIHAQSRVLMALEDARLRARRDMDSALEATDYSLEALRSYVARTPELCRPLQHIQSVPGVACRAAHFLRHVHLYMDKRPSAMPDRLGSTLGCSPAD